MGAEATTILVTGGAGYIGSHAAKALRRAGYRVVVYDNLCAGHREAVQWGELVQGDIADTATLRRTLAAHRVAAVMHFAAFLDVGESVRSPIVYYRNNVLGSLSVLDAMVGANVKHFVLSSTCATYGEPMETPIAETHQQAPINSYGETKLVVERALGHFERAYGLKSVALRYFNAAGADPDGEIGEDHTPEIHLVPRAIEAARGGPPLTIFGDDYPTLDGTCLRDYIHVTDLADAHVRALERLMHGAPSSIYNLGTGRPHSVREVIDVVSRVVERQVPFSVGPRRPGDPAALFAAPGKARRELEWTPQCSDLETIVRTAWHWHREHPYGYSARPRARVRATAPAAAQVPVMHAGN